MSSRPLERLARALDALTVPGVTVRDLVTPGFSLASTRLVRAIAAHGIRPATVLDVGANVGQFALATARQFPGAKILSFEPVPDVAATLRRNVRACPGVEVLECALGRSSGTVDFFRSAYTHVSSALPIHAANPHPNYAGAETTVVQVPIRRLDEVLATRTFAGPVVLKLDAQGFEAEVLAGAEAALPRIEWLVVESSFVQLYEGQPLFESLDRLIRSLGYEFIAPVGTQEGRDGMIIEMDGLYRRTSPG